MTQSEYDLQFIRLKNEWPNSFKSSKQTELYERVQHYPSYWFSQAISEILCQSGGSAPNLASIIDLTQKQAKRTNYQHRCDYCGGSGMMFCEPPDGMKNYELPGWARPCGSCAA